jgi:pantoate--beta-alanine ligase
MKPMVLHTIADLRVALRGESSRAFVPTMGNLHQGHLELVRHARSHASSVVASIFVNRLQFGPHEDFERYPRTLQADVDALSTVGCDYIFAPDESELYPVPQTFQLQPPSDLANCWEGQFRPGFFTGVATVVHKLFNIVQPQIAVFGQKDYQQGMLIEQMVQQMALPIQVVHAPATRAPDGLALSSRNGYLSPAERQQASELFAVLQNVAHHVRENGIGCAAKAEEQAIELLRSKGWRPDYLAVCRRSDLHRAQSGDEHLVILAAAWLGGTRLIDNFIF